MILTAKDKELAKEGWVPFGIGLPLPKPKGLSKVMLGLTGKILQSGNLKDDDFLSIVLEHKGLSLWWKLLDDKEIADITITDAD